MKIFWIIIFAMKIFSSLEELYQATYLLFPFSDQYQPQKLIKQIGTLTYAKCSMSCIKDSSCIGFNWLSNDKMNCHLLQPNDINENILEDKTGSFYYQKLGNCTPKCNVKSVCVIKANGMPGCRCGNWPDSCGPLCEDSFSVTKYKGLEGSNLEAYTNASEKYCKMKCLMNTSCFSFVYSTNENFCRLKSIRAKFDLLSNYGELQYFNLSESCSHM